MAKDEGLKPTIMNHDLGNGWIVEHETKRLSKDETMTFRNRDKNDTIALGPDSMRRLRRILAGTK